MKVGNYILCKQFAKIKIPQLCYDNNLGILKSSSLVTNEYEISEPFGEGSILENKETILISTTFSQIKYSKFILHPWQPNKKTGTIWPYYEIYNYGYNYSIELPEDYIESKSYPLVVFLHGGVNVNEPIHDWKSNFYSPKYDSYILIRPSKREVDWNPYKIRDIIEETKLNFRIDSSRIYLTGLSMGGRGTFIVCSELPHLFAAIMILSPHDEPYDYTLVANNLPKIPMLLSHGTNDMISSYNVSYTMYSVLKSKGHNIMFESLNTSHCCWFELYYRNSEKMKWLLSNKRLCIS